MKKTTCRDLKGACDEVIMGETAEEMGENSRKHVMEKIQAGDVDHKAAMEDMMKLSEAEQTAWYEGFKNSFDSLPEA